MKSYFNYFNQTKFEYNLQFNSNELLIWSQAVQAQAGELMSEGSSRFYRVEKMKAEIDFRTCNEPKEPSETHKIT